MIRTQSLPRAYQTAFSNGRHEIVADAPIDKGGGGTAFGAHELLEASLAVCINMAVRRSPRSSSASQASYLEMSCTGSVVIR
jgi:uncharacterized OsmC-like protein